MFLRHDESRRFLDALLVAHSRSQLRVAQRHYLGATHGSSKLRCVRVHSNDAWLASPVGTLDAVVVLCGVVMVALWSLLPRVCCAGPGPALNAAVAPARQPRKALPDSSPTADAPIVHDIKRAAASSFAGFFAFCKPLPTTHTPLPPRRASLDSTIAAAQSLRDAALHHTVLWILPDSRTMSSSTLLQVPTSRFPKAPRIQTSHVMPCRMQKAVCLNDDRSTPGLVLFRPSSFTPERHRFYWITDKTSGLDLALKYVEHHAARCTTPAVGCESITVHGFPHVTVPVRAKIC